MNQKHRLTCESWVEKRPEINYVTAYGTASSKHSIKWKTRYAMLVVSSETRLSEIRFYQKKPRSCTEITDDVIVLEPWQYIVDIPSWIVDKGRPHVLRLRLLPESVVPGQYYRLQIAYQSSEEATAWMRCIQNQTKLTSGIQGHSFGVVAEECSAAARIGVAGKHCLLFVSPTQVILAHKTDRSVVCVWPFETIRSYATDDDRRLVIEAGRCAPLGEGVYSFRTRENDDNVLFDLFDHYTTTATVEPRKPHGKSKDNRPSASHPDQTQSAPILSTSAESSAKSRKGKKRSGKPRPDKVALIPLSTSGITSEETDEPPQKPPLPENRKTVPVTPAKTIPDIKTTSNTVVNTKKKSIAHEEPPNKNKAADKVSKGLYDLDKLLYSLESHKRNHVPAENLGYDCPTTSRAAEEKEKQNTKGYNAELAYAVNTIKHESGAQQSMESPQIRVNEVHSKQRGKSKNTVLSSSAVKSDSGHFVKGTGGDDILADKPAPPYAKMDVDKKTPVG